MKSAMALLRLVLSLLGIICSFTVESSPRHTTTPSYVYAGHSSPSTVAFTVVKTADYNYPYDEVIRFDKVITNVGGAFQVSVNKVKIPTNGLYYFSFSARTKALGDTVDLVKNDERLVSAMGRTAANAVVVHAKMGDTVYVGARKGSGVQSSVHNTKTTFSGFLIESGNFDAYPKY